MGSSSLPVFCSHFALFFFLFTFLPSPLSALNVTSALSSYPDFSSFTRLLASTTIPSAISNRSSLTILAVPNRGILRRDSSAFLSTSSSDSLSFHILLQYLSLSELRRLPPSGRQVPTLFQSSGRVIGSNGTVNLTVSPGGAVVLRSLPSSFLSFSVAVEAQIADLPYDLSILSVDSLIVPPDLDLSAAADTLPPLGFNITRVLVDARTFNVGASMLAASGVAEEFDSDECGAGITVFVPTDLAFAEQPSNHRLQSLPAERKAVVLRYHVLHSYYPLGSLQSILNPAQPTLATEESGAGQFTLNITRLNGSVAIDTGIVLASITQTIFDQKPISIFAVSQVLLPRDVFGRPGEGGAAASEAAAPRSSPDGVDGQSSQPLPPPAVRGEIRSDGGDGNLIGRAFVLIAVWFCTMLCFIL